MKVGLDYVKGVLQRFAVVYPFPAWVGNFEEYADIWQGVLEEYEVDEVSAACRALLRKLTRFPYPAEVVTEIESRRAADKAPNEIPDAV